MKIAIAVLLLAALIAAAHLSGIHPYPTQAEAVRKAADTYNRTRLTPWTRRLLRWWLTLARSMG